MTSESGTNKFFIDFLKYLEESIISPQRISRLTAKMGDEKDDLIACDNALYRSKQANKNNNNNREQNIKNAFNKLYRLTNSKDIILSLLKTRANLDDREIPNKFKPNNTTIDNPSATNAVSGLGAPAPAATTGGMGHGKPAKSK